MILQALNSYYERLVSDGADIPQTGFSNEKISFCVLFDKNGGFVAFEDIRDHSAKKPQPVLLTVPASEKRPGQQIKAFLLWDNSDYAIGIDSRDKPEQAIEKFAAFKALNTAFCKDIDSVSAQAFVRFLEQWNPDDVEPESLPEDIRGSNIVFRLDGNMNYVHEDSLIKKRIAENAASSDDATVRGLCLVTGNDNVPLARLHQSIQGVQGAQSSGASLVSFNQDSFTSYGKEQSYNSPVSESAAFAYGTVLNRLLAKNSKQKYTIEGTTFVFWSEKKSEAENLLKLLFGGNAETDKETDDTSANAKIQRFMESARAGTKLPDEFGDASVKFYILGLSPNAARISVRFWLVDTLGDLHKKIGQHLADCDIETQRDYDRRFPTLWSMLTETALGKEQKNIVPTLEGAYLSAILTGGLYPETMLNRIMNRIRADKDINHTRAYVLKGYLNRKSRILNKKTEVSMSLDKNNAEPAYLLGRLFAVLEKAQSEAVRNANSTIKDRYFGAASATPASVFPILLRLSQHHIDKAEYGRVSDMRIQEIMDKLDKFPKVMNLQQQGLFAIGYYQQKNDFYKKTDKEETE